MRNRLTETVSIINTLARKDIKLDQDEFRELFQTVVNNARLLQDELTNILRYLESPALLYSDAGFRFDQLRPLLLQISEVLGIKPPDIEGAEELGTARTAISGLAMESILWELVRNAKKFHPAKLPEVTIILDRPDDRSVRMKIMDNGITLSPEQLTRVWTPYYQGDPRLSGKAEGLGLGLPTTASFIWHWGGSCRLYNRADRPGVVVELVLPIGNGQ